MLVSICVPLYNVEDCIERCAVSLFEQSYPEKEFIFVDDCSPDSSVDKLRQVMTRYPEIKEQTRIICHEKNRGLAAARNTALDNCNGEFVIHVDSDDYLDTDAVKKLVTRQTETDADIVTGQAIRIDKGMVCIMERPHFLAHDDFVADMIRPSIHHTVWGRLIRKSLYIDFNIRVKEGINIGEDLQIMSKLAYYAKKVETIWDVVYYYDCTNALSYMNLFDVKDFYRLSQDTASMEIVRDFFIGKNEKFQDCAEKYLSRYYLDQLRFFGHSGMRDDFDRTKELLTELKPQNRRMSAKLRAMFHNYLSFKITEFLFK